VHPPLVPLAWLAVQPKDVAGGGQGDEGLRHGFHIVEVVHPLDPVPQLTGRLRAPQHQHSQQSNIALFKAQVLVEDMAVFRHSSPAAGMDKAD
jgi:hypothetical protein